MPLEDGAAADLRRLDSGTAAAHAGRWRNRRWGGGTCGTQFALTPAPSALYVLFDTESGMRDFVGNAGAAEALSLSLQDPVFNQTQVGS